MALIRINTTAVQTAETNVDWYANGEKADGVVLSRPIKPVAGVVNLVMDEVDANVLKSVNMAVAMAIALG